MPLLTAVGNDRGSGDFHEGNIGFEFVGLWAWNLISISDSAPKSFKKFDLVFAKHDEEGATIGLSSADVALLKKFIQQQNKKIEQVVLKEVL